jgi:hypothetical protein
LFSVFYPSFSFSKLKISYGNLAYLLEINIYTKCLHILSPSGGNKYCLWDVVDFLGCRILRKDWASTGETDETRKVRVNYLSF